MDVEILDSQEEYIGPRRRRDLLPKWIKVFLWIFLIMSLMVPISIVMGFLDKLISLSLYGFNTFYPLSIAGIFILSLMAFKGITAYSLWTEKDIAVDLAIIDAILGIAICIIAMIVLPFLDATSIKFEIRLELIALIPYFMHMRKIKPHSPF